MNVHKLAEQISPITIAISEIVGPDPLATPLLRVHQELPFLLKDHSVLRKEVLWAVLLTSPIIVKKHKKAYVLVSGMKAYELALALLEPHEMVNVLLLPPRVNESQLHTLISADLLLRPLIATVRILHYVGDLYRALRTTQRVQLFVNGCSQEKFCKACDASRQTLFHARPELSVDPVRDGASGEGVDLTQLNTQQGEEQDDE